MRLRCAQYFVITSCGLVSIDNICVYMEHVCFYVRCSDCTGVCGIVCCVAGVVKDSVLALDYLSMLCVCIGCVMDGVLYV